VEINNNPHDANLYLKRGELYFQFEEYQKSLLDFQECKNLGFKETSLDYQIASVLLRLKNYSESLSITDRLIEQQLKLSKAWRLKGRIYYLIEEYSLAGQAFEEAIEHTQNPTPDQYMEASHAWEKSLNNSNLLNAKNILVQGLDELGYLDSFYNRLIELEIKSENFPDAISYACILVDNGKKKENILIQRSYLYKLNGDLKNAAKDLRQAKKLILKRNLNLNQKKEQLQFVDQELKSLKQTSK